MKKHADGAADSALCRNRLHGQRRRRLLKHERVYVVVNHDGEVQTLLDNVHLENSDALDVLSDRSMLSSD